MSETNVATRPLITRLSPGEQRLAILGFRDSWEARCHFCGGPSFAWLTRNETWAKVEPLLGQQQACFECFSAAWMLLGLNTGEPFHISDP